MMPMTGESIVALDHLDSHLKALLKLRLREFVHLGPWFEEAAEVEMPRFSGRDDLPFTEALNSPPERDPSCPNRHGRNLNRRRPMRPLPR
ncbi:MAG TPA: hypothetical protein V6D17_24530 [Candidatus Obscuribacterales bacterium]